MNPRTDRVVIVMAKQPTPGRTKTRLTPALSRVQAADFYECLLQDTLALLQRREDCGVLIAVDRPESQPYFNELAGDVGQVSQVGDALGERLDSVLSEALDRGFQQVFAISSDSPDLPSTHLDDVFAALDRSEVDVVLGPTEDGGYYLIGWKQPWPEVVREVEMSTPRVLHDTLSIASRVGANVHLGPTWYDVDVPSDLDRLSASVSGSELRSQEFLRSL